MRGLPLFLFTLFLFGCAEGRISGPAIQRFEYQRLCMGVQTRVVLYADDPAWAESAAAAAFGRIADLDQCMSDYRPTSELSQFALKGAERPLVISDDLMRVLRTAAHVSDASNGAFDVTVGPLVSLWRDARTSGLLPDAARLDEARALVDWRSIRLDQREHSAMLAQRGMRLDLGGIGKGFAAQEAVELLRKRGALHCLVALAGDIVVGQSPPGSEGWRIGFGPGADESEAGSAVYLENCAISTSGDTVQFVEIDGVRYSHIVDPRTGLGLTNRVVATVIAPRGELADALASAASVLGPEEGWRLVRRFARTQAAFWRIDDAGHATRVPEPRRGILGAWKTAPGA